MKIAISSTGKELTDKVSEVFARCPYFIIVDIENQKIKKFEALKNESEAQMGGAGISAAQLMAEKNVDAVITGNVGPRALDILGQFNIKIYLGRGSVKEEIQKYIDGELEEIKR